MQNIIISVFQERSIFIFNHYCKNNRVDFARLFCQTSPSLDCYSNLETSEDLFKKLENRESLTESEKNLKTRHKNIWKYYNSEKYTVSYTKYFEKEKFDKSYVKEINGLTLELLYGNKPKGMTITQYRSSNIYKQDTEKFQALVRIASDRRTTIDNFNYKYIEFFDGREESNTRDNKFFYIFKVDSGYKLYLVRKSEILNKVHNPIDSNNRCYDAQIVPSEEQVVIYFNKTIDVKGKKFLKQGCIYIQNNNHNVLKGIYVTFDTNLDTFNRPVSKKVLIYREINDIMNYESISRFSLNKLSVLNFFENETKAISDINIGKFPSINKSITYLEKRFDYLIRYIKDNKENIDNPYYNLMQKSMEKDVLRIRNFISGGHAYILHNKKLQIMYCFQYIKERLENYFLDTEKIDEQIKKLKYDRKLLRRSTGDKNTYEFLVENENYKVQIRLQRNLRFLRKPIEEICIVIHENKFLEKELTGKLLEDFEELIRQVKSYTKKIVDFSFKCNFVLVYNEKKTVSFDKIKKIFDKENVDYLWTNDINGLMFKKDAVFFKEHMNPGVLVVSLPYYTSISTSKVRVAISEDDTEEFCLNLETLLANSIVKNT